MVADRELGMMEPKWPGVTSGTGLSKSRMEPMNKRNRLPVAEQNYRIKDIRKWKDGENDHKEKCRK